MNNLKQLEYLVRLHVMIAMVYSKHDEKCLQNFLASLGYVTLIWKVTTQRICVMPMIKYFLTESLCYDCQRKPHGKCFLMLYYIMVFLKNYLMLHLTIFINL